MSMWMWGTVGSMETTLVVVRGHALVKDGIYTLLRYYRLDEYPGKRYAMVTGYGIGPRGVGIKATFVTPMWHDTEEWNATHS